MNQSTGTPANITDASAASYTRSAQARRLSAAADVIYENVDHDSGIDYGAAEEIARAVLEALSKVPDDAPTSDVRAALRAAANEVDRLRRQVSASQLFSQVQMNNYNRLRTVIENAPHAPGCGFGGTFAVSHGDSRPDGGPIPCSCWKKDEQ